MSRNWIAVASAEHVRRGRTQGFMQVCHGRLAPLRRIHAGDRVAYYSPATQFGGKDGLRSFTAVGTVSDRDPYPDVLDKEICMYRRDVHWLDARDAQIAPLLGDLEFAAGRRNWAYPMRFGLFEVSCHDWCLIAAAMAAVPLASFAAWQMLARDGVQMR